jgi:hypothetical protein
MQYEMIDRMVNAKRNQNVYLSIGGARRRTPAEMGSVERASEDDRLWFGAHPLHRVRVREAWPDEWDADLGEPVPDGYRLVIAVELLAPGVRARFPLAHVLPTPGFTDLAPDQIAEVWQHYSDDRRANGYQILESDGIPQD